MRRPAWSPVWVAAGAVDEGVREEALVGGAVASGALRGRTAVTAGEARWWVGVPCVAMCTVRSSRTQHSVEVSLSSSVLVALLGVGGEQRRSWRGRVVVPAAAQLLRSAFAGAASTSKCLLLLIGVQRFDGVRRRRLRARVACGYWLLYGRSARSRVQRLRVVRRRLMAC